MRAFLRLALLAASVLLLVVLPEVGRTTGAACLVLATVGILAVLTDVRHADGGMSTERIMGALQAIHHDLGRHHAAARGCAPGRPLVPERMSEEDMARPFQDVGLEKAMAHLSFMSLHAADLLAQGRREKVMRWLGFQQGAMWAMGMRTVSQSKDDNRPESRG